MYIYLPPDLPTYPLTYVPPSGTGPSDIQLSSHAGRRVKADATTTATTSTTTMSRPPANQFGGNAHSCRKCEERPKCESCKKKLRRADFPDSQLPHVPNMRCEEDCEPVWWQCKQLQAMQGETEVRNL